MLNAIDSPKSFFFIFFLVTACFSPLEKRSSSQWCLTTSTSTGLKRYQWWCKKALAQTRWIRIPNDCSTVETVSNSKSIIIKWNSINFILIRLNKIKYQIREIVTINRFRHQKQQIGKLMVFGKSWIRHAAKLYNIRLNPSAGRKKQKKTQTL